MKEYTSLNHAEHNESVCEHLSINTGFDDWVITTAFYSALHYLRHKLFPVTIPKGGKTIVANTFSEYCSVIGKYNQKHKVMRELIEHSCGHEIAANYNNLLDICWSARYSNYHFSKKVTQLAKRRLQIIKSYCIH